MFRDTKEELQRLEQELLEEQEQPKDTFEEDPLGDYVNQPVKCRVYNTDHTDVDLEEFSAQVREPEKSLTGWIVLCFVLMTGIVCILGYWVLRYLGVLG